MVAIRSAAVAGECGEVAAAADLVTILDLGSSSDAEALEQLAGRVSAMLTRLILRLTTGAEAKSVLVLVASCSWRRVRELGATAGATRDFHGL
jgi:hypothetical protein